MSASEVHAAVKRCLDAGLYNAGTREPNRAALHEFLVHGLRYVFPAQPGAFREGLPTSFAAPPLRHRFQFSTAEAPVMPLLSGPARGPEIPPLYRSAPAAARNDEGLYHLLAVVDALRSGRSRERKAAVEVLSELLS